MIWVPYRAGIFFLFLQLQMVFTNIRFAALHQQLKAFVLQGRQGRRIWVGLDAFPCSGCSSFPTGLYHKRNFLRTCMLPQSFIRTHGKVLGEEPTSECGLPMYLWLPEVFLNSHTGLHLAFSNSLKPRTEFLPDRWCPGYGVSLK